MPTFAELRLAQSFACALELPAASSQLEVARRFARETAAAAGLEEDSVYELVFAVNEAVTNAIRHGRPDERGLIHVSAVAEGRRVTITVRDSGTFRMPVERPGANSDHGRGLALMARFTDHSVVNIANGTTAVSLSKDRW